MAQVQGAQDTAEAVLRRPTVAWMDATALPPVGGTPQGGRLRRHAGHQHAGAGQWPAEYRRPQGTVWGWLIGPVVSAHLRVYRDPAVARSFLRPLLQQLEPHVVGSLSEILNGDPPFAPHGCIAHRRSGIPQAGRARGRRYCGYGWKPLWHRTRCDLCRLGQVDVE